MDYFCIERGADVKFTHTKSKNKSKYFSLIIVPHFKFKHIRQIKIPIWIPKFLIIVLLFSIVSTGFLIHSFIRLKDDYQAKIENLKTLKEINQQQKQEINTLEQKTSEIEEKLKTITELQETVKQMVGLQKTDEDNNPQSTSRGGSQIIRNDFLTYNTNNIEKHIDDLSILLDQSKEDLKNLIDDVDKKLKYLDAKPNLMPTTGRITSGFGYRRNPFGSGREFHTGIDIANSYNTEIKAAGSGVVTFAGYNGGYGRVIMISHGYGYQSIYGHNNKILVKVGQKVEKGQVIALMGSTGRSTGPHLHFEIRYYGKAVNPKTVINNIE